MSSIGLNLNKVYLNGLNAQTTKPIFTSQKTQTPITKSNLVKPGINHLKANFLSFKGPTDATKMDSNKIEEAIKHFDIESNALWNKALELAKESKSEVLTSHHFLKAAVQGALRLLNDHGSDCPSLLAMADRIKPEILDNDNYSLAFEIELEELENKLDKIINELPKSENGIKGVSEEFAEIINDSYKAESEHWDGSKKPTISASTIIALTAVEDFQTKIPRGNNELFNFLEKIRNLSISEENSSPSPTKMKKVTIKSEGTVAENVPVKIRKKEEFDLEIFKAGQIELTPIANDDGCFNFANMKQKAKVVANVVSAGRNANLVFDYGSKPELVAHTFASMVKDGDFKDLSPDNTTTFLWDAHKVFAEGNPKKQIGELKSLAREAEKDGKHRVVFIKDFHRFINLREPNMKDYINAEMFGDKLHIIGMTQKDILNEMTAPVNGHKEAISLQWQNKFEEIPITSASPKQTKEMMLKDTRLIYQITAEHDKNIFVEPDAINKTVDIAAGSRSGSLPGKALDLLDLIVAGKCNNNKNVDRITEEDVTTYLSAYPEFKQSPVSGTGQFTLVNDTGITLKDVGGAAQAREVVEEVLDFIKYPEKFEITGAKMPKGVLLSGTPGNGKTHMAKAIAGEAGVPFISVSGSQFVEKYVGVGASRIRELFDFARDQAQANAEPGKKGTAIIFIDEFDALGRKRGGDSSSGGQEAEQTLNQLLVEMDGLKPEDNTNIIVLGATNRPDLLDEALTERPGRFDHKIEVPNPANDKDARFEILEIHARNKEFEGDRTETLKELADRTSGASGARLADILNKACIIAAKDGRAKLNIDDLIEAKLESAAGRVNKTNNKPEWYKELVIAHECGHALNRQIMFNLAQNQWHLPREIDLITTQPRGTYGGAVYSKPSDNVSHTFESTFAELVSNYGGHSVEKAFYNMNGSWGISSDLKNAKTTALEAVTKMGMGPQTGTDIPLTDELSQENREDIKLFLKQSVKAADLIVNFHKEFIEEYTERHKGGSNLSNKDFIKELNSWHNAKPERKAQLNELAQQIYSIMKETQQQPKELNEVKGFAKSLKKK